MSRTWQDKDFYGELGVPVDATNREIKSAYHQLARTYHPDVNPGDPTAEAKFKRISEAYAVLKDPEKRRRYDLVRSVHGQQSQFHRTTTHTRTQTRTTRTRTQTGTQRTARTHSRTGTSTGSGGRTGARTQRTSGSARRAQQQRTQQRQDAPPGWTRVGDPIEAFNMFGTGTDPNIRDVRRQTRQTSARTTSRTTTATGRSQPGRQEDRQGWGCGRIVLVILLIWVVITIVVGITTANALEMQDLVDFVSTGLTNPTANAEPSFMGNCFVACRL